MSDNDATAAHEIEVTRDDQQELWRRGVRAMEAQIEEQRPVVRAEREARQQREQYGLRDSLFFRVVKMVTREGDPDRWRATCIAGMPDPSMQVYADGVSVEEAVHEARFRYAQALYSAKVENDFEKARNRAAKADLRIADVVK